VGFSFRHDLQPDTSPLFNDVDVLKQVHAMTSILAEQQLRPLLLVRALDSGGVFKRDLNGKTTSNDELEEELYGQSLPQHYPHSFTRFGRSPSTLFSKSWYL